MKIRSQIRLLVVPFFKKTYIILLYIFFTWPALSQLAQDVDFQEMVLVLRPELEA